MNVSTGMRNPFTIDDMAEITTRYFRERPLPDEDGLPVEVPEWRLSSRGRGHDRAQPRRRAARAGPRPRRPAAAPAQRRGRAAPAQEPAQGRPPAPPERDLLALRRARLRLRRPQRARAARTSCTPTTASASASTSTRSTGTTTSARSTCRRCARSPCRPRPARRRRARPAAAPAPEGPPALAIFDVEGVVLDSHRRALLRLAAHARHARARQARVDGRRRRPRARLDHGGPPLAHRLQPQLLPPLQGPAGARAARAGQGGAAGLHPAADPARGRPPDPRAQAPRRQGDPDHRRARLPRRVARSTSATS